MDRCSERENPYPPAQLTSPPGLTGFTRRRFAPPLHIAQHTAYLLVASLLVASTRSQAPRVSVKEVKAFFHVMIAHRITCPLNGLTKLDLDFFRYPKLSFQSLVQSMSTLEYGDTKLP